MGKPFAVELESLAATYDWSVRESIDSLVHAIRSLNGLPLIAVGSGGSFTAAHFACELHRFHTRQMAQALTPLQAISSDTRMRDLAIMLPTAGGKNPDVLGAFRHLVAREPRRFLVWCGSPGSRLSAAASKYRFVDFHEYSLPSGKDGFLAVNSLLAFTVLVARAYSEACGVQGRMPASIADYLCRDEWNCPGKVDRHYADIWKRQTLVVLHGPSTLAAAIDLESKFTEAALGSVQIADFRHFAHGRHHWIAKRGRQSGVLALTTDDDRRQAEQLLALLPSDIPVVRIDVPYSGWMASLAAMIQGFFLTASAGRARDIDPGDPGVPAFGRSIYRLNVYDDPGSCGEIPMEEAVAIERKAGAVAASMIADGQLAAWREAYRSARKQLEEAIFCGLVLDYDGTLCDEADRFGPLPAEMASHIIRLIKADSVIGIATGRGKSVRKSLQQALPRKLWRKVVIGYYNGSQVSTLDDDSCPDNREGVVPELRPFADRIGSDRFLAPLIDCTFRMKQITLSPTTGMMPALLWEHVHTILLSLPWSGATAIRSAHSVDIVAPGVTKLAVVDRVRRLTEASDRPVLRIGDQGRWPGNDFELLASPHGLSVDQVSSDLEQDGIWLRRGIEEARPHWGISAYLGRFARAYVWDCE